jgi:hypothetical protein
MATYLFQDDTQVERVRECDLPANALSQRYRASGTYTDCFHTKIARAVSHAEFVEAFYTTRLFRLERWILALIVARPSTDAEARALALGRADRFAAWTVEQRAPDQVLLRDFTGRTCSWLMTKPGEKPGSTLLYFGSVVTPARDARTGRAQARFRYSLVTGISGTARGSVSPATTIECIPLCRPGLPGPCDVLCSWCI